MNPSDWIKAATLITQQKQEAATTDTDQLSSMPLSQLAMDDSGPPVMHYGMHMPTATSTPTHTEIDTHSSQQEDTYQQIIPGIPQGSLYPTLASLNSEEGTLPEETQTLWNKVSKGLEKYLQDAEQCQALEVNYFDDNTTGQNDESSPEDAEQTIQQHYYRFSQYIKFEMKSDNIRDPVGEAIELFEHTLDKKALVWFQVHKDKFVDLTALKTMFLQRYNPWGKTK